jgi:hypothetical protein
MLIYWAKLRAMKKNVEEAIVVARQKDYLEVKEQEYGYVLSRSPITANNFR